MKSIIESSTSPRTDAVIAKVMADYPGESRAAQARYFEAVHQELAPLCRELEAENRALREQLCHPRLKPGNLTKLASSEPVA